MGNEHDVTLLGEMRDLEAKITIVIFALKFLILSFVFKQCFRFIICYSDFF